MTMDKILNFFKKSKYRIFLIIYSLVLLIVVTVCLSLLWSYISRYEELKPEKAVRDILNSKDAEFWKDIVNERYVSRVTEFEDVETVVQKLDLSDISSDKLSFYKRVNEYTEDSAVYTLYYKNKELAVLKLKQAEKYSLGLVKWEFDTIYLSLNDEEANSVGINVTIPPEYSVSVNGVVVEEKYISEQRVEYSDVLDFEKGVEGVPFRVKYSVSGLFDLPEVEIKDKDGNIIPSNIHGYEYSVESKSSNKNEITVKCPSDYTLKLNGVEVPSSYITDNNCGYELLDEVKGFNGSVPAMVLYKVSGLYLSPDVKLYDKSGNEVEVDSVSDGNYEYLLQSDASTEALYKETVENFVKSYIKYTADGATNINANYNDVLSYILYGSTADNLIRGSYSGVIWNNTYNVKYNKLEVDNFIMYGDNAFSCYVDYDVLFTRYIYSSEKKGEFKLVFVKSGDTFKLSKLVIG